VRAQLGPGTYSSNFFAVGPSLDVHREDDRWWTTCPACPGWSAAADSWADLYRLVSEWHASEEAPHRGWLMVAATETSTTWTTAS
jgi:hypothetical protein